MKRGPLSEMGPAGCKQFLALPHPDGKDIRVIVRLPGMEISARQSYDGSLLHEKDIYLSTVNTTSLASSDALMMCRRNMSFQAWLTLPYPTAILKPKSETCFNFHKVCNPDLPRIKWQWKVPLESSSK